jgi:hypothetical protein
MGTKKSRILPALGDSVRRRFEHWRRTRGVLSHIPEPLWAAAVDMAGRCGISHTAKTLRVNYNALRKRVEHQAAAAPRRPEENTVTTFLELAPPRELALANALWSWRTTRGRRCGSISKALRHPTWQR